MLFIGGFPQSFLLSSNGLGRRYLLVESASFVQLFVHFRRHAKTHGHERWNTTLAYRGSECWYRVIRNGNFSCLCSVVVW